MIERRRSPRACQPAPAHLELARWLLAQEMRDGRGGSLDVPDAGERACQKLLDRLAKMITPDGTRSATR